jgi:hypothetical protein
VKNNRFTTVIGVVVILVLLLLLLFRNRSPFGKNNTSFASEPKKEITKVQFLQGKEKLTLEKAGDEWILNGRTEARKSGVLFILRVLKDIKIKSPVSQELFESEIIAKNVDPVKVMVFEKRKIIKSLYVYKTASNTYGNIMKMGAGAKPFIVYMPGFEGDIGSGFTLNELFWQPYTVFNLLPSEISSVDFENIADTVNSFTIQSNNRHYSLSGGIRNLSGWDTALVTRYLSYFTRIPFESWAFDLDEMEKQKIKSARPLYRITVKTVSGSEITLSLWERMTGEADSQQKDSDRLIGKTDSRDEFFIIRYFDIDPLLKKRSYFFAR